MRAVVLLGVGVHGMEEALGLGSAEHAVGEEL